MIGVPVSAITNGPWVQWRHVDGPCICWAGHIHWMTLRERLKLVFGKTSIDEIASYHWPHLARQKIEFRDFRP